MFLSGPRSHASSEDSRKGGVPWESGGATDAERQVGQRAREALANPAR
jgi:hypothetical protein